MRIAALDVGEARIGVAVSDELGITAQGLGVVRRVGGRRDLEALATLLAPYAPSRLVVGLPLDMRGTEGAAAARVRAFAERVAAHLALPLEFWDERLTTGAAERARSEEHTSELQSLAYLVCRLLLEKKKTNKLLRCTPLAPAVAR